jgi:hypothetical protein
MDLSNLGWKITYGNYNEVCMVWNKED